MSETNKITIKEVAERRESSKTSSVLAGSIRVTSSNCERKSALRFRTVSEIPMQLSCQPPNWHTSAFWTIHSSSRIKARAPGAGA